MEQTAVGIGDGLLDLRAAGPAVLDEQRLQQGHGLGDLDLDAHTEKALRLAAAHRQDAVRRGLGGRLFPVEIVLELGALGLLAREHLGLKNAFGRKKRAQTGACLLVLADPLGYDVARAGQGLLGGPHALLLAEIGGGEDHGVVAALLVNFIGQRFQAFFFGDGGAGAALRTERQVDIFEPGQRLGAVYLRLELRRQQIALGERLKYGLAAGVEFFELRQALPYLAQRHFVQAAGGLLAVAGHERNSGVFAKKFYRRGHAAGVQPEFARDLGHVRVAHSRPPESNSL